MTEHTARTCALCPRMCRFTCPVTTGTGDETATPTTMMQIWGLAQQGAVGWEMAAEALSRCTGCEACREPCEFDADVPALLYAARAEAWEQGAVPAGARAMHDVYLRSGNPFGVDVTAELLANAEDADFDRKGRVMYWPGCRELAERPERQGDVMRLFRAIGADHVSLPARQDEPGCCGGPLRAVGDTSGLAMAAAGLHQYFGRQRTWVTPSTECLQTVLKGWPDSDHALAAEVLHVTEYLLFFKDNIAELGRRAMESAKPPLPALVVHDACGLRRRLNRGDAVYEVLEAATGVRPEPFGPTPERTICCGAGDFHDLRRPEAAQAVARYAVRDRALPPGAMVVTGDAGCLGSLRGALPSSVPVHDVVGFLLQWLSPALE